MECHRIVLQNKRGLEGALKGEGGRRKGRGRGRGGGGRPATIADCVTSLHEVEGQCVQYTGRYNLNRIGSNLGHWTRPERSVSFNMLGYTGLADYIFLYPMYPLLPKSIEEFWCISLRLS